MTDLHSSAGWIRKCLWVNVCSTLLPRLSCYLEEPIERENKTKQNKTCFFFLGNRQRHGEHPLQLFSTPGIRLIRIQCIKPTKTGRSPFLAKEVVTAPPACTLPPTPPPSVGRLVIELFGLWTLFSLQWVSSRWSCCVLFIPRYFMGGFLWTLTPEPVTWRAESSYFHHISAAPSPSTVGKPFDFCCLCVSIKGSFWGDDFQEISNGFKTKSWLWFLISFPPSVLSFVLLGLQRFIKVHLSFSSFTGESRRFQRAKLVCAEAEPVIHVAGHWL